MTTSDPWSGISPPARNSFSARRVPNSGGRDLYWAVDADRNPLLILEYQRGGRRPSRLPNLRGLRVERLPADKATHERIVIRLVDREQRDIFLRFCRDIVDATVRATTEEQAVELLLARTWRWHRLLQGGRDGRLSDEEQKGLVGELLVLEQHLLPRLDATDAVRCWTGPLGTPQDFEVGGIHVEAKARGSTTPRISISSELQLESGNADMLFLHVTEVVIATEGTAGASTVTDVAERIRATIASHALVAAEFFEERLCAVGFDWADDYSDKPWLVAGESLYEVRDGFPCITPGMFAGGVENVRYAISLPDCESFRVDPSTLGSAVEEMVSVP